MDVWTGLLLAGMSFAGVGLGLTLFGALPLRWRRVFCSPHRQRDIHQARIPRVGGITIIPISLISMWLAIRWGILASDLPWSGIIWGALMVLGYGVWDEQQDLSWKVQLIIQISIGVVLVASGVTIAGIMIPFGELWNLQSVLWQAGSLTLYPLSAAVTLLWVVGLMNVVNWLDGLDGLAAGTGIIAFGTLAILATTPFVGQTHITLISLILLGSYAGALWFNWYPAKIFLGTSGSMYLGYMLAVLSLMSGGKIGTSALVFAVPILDAGIVIIRRMLAGTLIFEADKRHLHYGLLSLGWSQVQVVGLLYGVSVFFGICALLFDTVGKFIVFVLGAGVLVGLTVWIKTQHQPESSVPAKIWYNKNNGNHQKQYETRI